jgi:hypothetical protein
MTGGPGIGIDSDWFPVHRSVMQIGRRSLHGSAPDVDLGPFDPRRQVSRRHAEVTCDGGVVHLRDLDSRNGTNVNGRPIGRAAVQLRDGDRLDFAQVEATFAQHAPWPAGIRAEWAEAPGQSAQRPAVLEPTQIGRRGPLRAPKPDSRRPWWHRLAWWRRRREQV